MYWIDPLFPYVHVTNVLFVVRHRQTDVTELVHETRPGCEDPALDPETVQHLLQVLGLHPRHDDGPGGRVAVNDVPGDGVEGGQEEGVEADLAIVTDEAHVVTRPSGQQSQQTARVI